MKILYRNGTRESADLLKEQFVNTTVVDRLGNGPFTEALINWGSRGVETVNYDTKLAGSPFVLNSPTKTRALGTFEDIMEKAKRAPAGVEVGDYKSLTELAAAPLVGTWVLLNTEERITTDAAFRQLLNRTPENKRASTFLRPLIIGGLFVRYHLVRNEIIAVQAKEPLTTEVAATKLKRMFPDMPDEALHVLAAQPVVGGALVFQNYQSIPTAPTARDILPTTIRNFVRSLNLDFCCVTICNHKLMNIVTAPALSPQLATMYAEAFRRIMPAPVRATIVAPVAPPAAPIITREAETNTADPVVPTQTELRRMAEFATPEEATVIMRILERVAATHR